MYNFEEYCEKYTNHNSAINVKDFNITKLPTVRIKLENNMYKLGITLHKWDMVPSGKALSILTFGDPIYVEDIFWTNPEKSEILDQLKYAKDFINQIKETSLEQLVLYIENNECTFDNLYTFKYHANQWREIFKKKTKWTYKNKDIKSEICNVQRLLN